jgi:hypothetical protein
MKTNKIKLMNKANKELVPPRTQVSTLPTFRHSRGGSTYFEKRVYTIKSGIPLKSVPLLILVSKQWRRRYSHSQNALSNYNIYLTESG